MILYLGFLEGLISHFEKLGQGDLKKCIKNLVKNYFKFLKNHKADFNEI